MRRIMAESGNGQPIATDTPAGGSRKEDIVTEPATHSGRAGRGADLRRAAQRLQYRANPAADRVADGASGFGTLAGYFTDRTVVTYDPRRVERGKRTDGAIECGRFKRAFRSRRLLRRRDERHGRGKAGHQALRALTRKLVALQKKVPSWPACANCSSQVSAASAVTSPASCARRA